MSVPKKPIRPLSNPVLTLIDNAILLENILFPMAKTVQNMNKTAREAPPAFPGLRDWIDRFYAVAAAHISHTRSGLFSPRPSPHWLLEADHDRKIVGAGRRRSLEVPASRQRYYPAANRHERVKAGGYTSVYMFFDDPGQMLRSHFPVTGLVVEGPGATPPGPMSESGTAMVATQAAPALAGAAAFYHILALLLATPQQTNPRCGYRTPARAASPTG